METISFVIIPAGNLTGVLIKDEIHILGGKKTRYGMTIGGKRYKYVCICYNPNCEMGELPKIEALVNKAKKLGANQVVVRNTDEGDFRITELCELPISDPSFYVGVVNDYVSINREE